MEIRYTNENNLENLQVLYQEELWSNNIVIHKVVLFTFTTILLQTAAAVLTYW